MRRLLVPCALTLLSLAACKREAQETVAEAKGAAADAKRATSDAVAQAKGAASDAKSAVEDAAARARAASDDAAAKARAAAADAKAKAAGLGDSVQQGAKDLAARARGGADAAGTSLRDGVDSAGRGVREGVDSAGRSVRELASGDVVTGTLTRVGAQVTVTPAQGAPVELATDGSTRWIVKGAAGAPGGLSAGTAVRATYIVRDGRKLATEIATVP